MRFQFNIPIQNERYCRARVLYIFGRGVIVIECNLMEIRGVSIEGEQQVVKYQVCDTVGRKYDLMTHKGVLIHKNLHYFKKVYKLNKIFFKS